MWGPLKGYAGLGPKGLHNMATRDYVKACARLYHPMMLLSNDCVRNLGPTFPIPDISSRLFLSLSLSLYIYIYMYMIYVYKTYTLYMYIIQRDRERERERETVIHVEFNFEVANKKILH